MTKEQYDYSYWVEYPNQEHYGLGVIDGDDFVGYPVDVFNIETQEAYFEKRKPVRVKNVVKKLKLRIDPIYDNPGVKYIDTPGGLPLL